MSVGHVNGIRNPRPGAFEFLQVHFHDNHANSLALTVQAPRIGEPVRPGRILGDGKQRGVGPQRVHEKRIIAMIGPQPRAVRGRHRAAALIQQQQRRRPDFIHKGNQTGGRLRKIVRVQRTDQRRVLGQKLRHDGIAAQLRQQVSRIQRQAQFGPVVGVLREAIGQQTVGDPDRDPGNDKQHQNGRARAPTGGLRP